MRKFQLHIWILVAALLWAHSISYAKNAAGDSSPAGNSRGDKPGDDGDPNPDSNNGKPGDHKGQNCSVIYEMNVGSFQTEFNRGDVYLRIKRLKPTPLIFTPHSLQFDSPLASDVFLTPQSEEAESVAQAELLIDVASADVIEASDEKNAAEQNKDSAYANLQAKELLLQEAQDALAGDPNNPSLQQAVAYAEAERNLASVNYNSASALYSVAMNSLNNAEAALLVAQNGLVQAQNLYSAYLAAQQNAGTLIKGLSGFALGRIAIQRPKGTLIAYEPDVNNGLWKPIGAERYYASRLKTLSDSSFARLDGRGNEFIFNAVEGALPRLKLPTGKEITLGSEGVRQEVIRRSGVIRQVVTPQAFIDVVILGSFAYEVRLYDIGSITNKNGDGLYVPSGQFFAKFKVENPTGDINQLNHVRITTTKGARAEVLDWVYYESDGGWSLSVGEGSDRVRVRKTITEISSTEEIYQWETFDSDDQLVGRENETYTQFPWGKMTTTRITDPGGENLTETLTYYDNPLDGEKYGKLKTQVNADGSWVKYEYDAMGREAVKVEPWLDSPVGSDPIMAKATYYDYTSVDARDVLMDYDRRVRAEIVKVLGETVRKTFYAYFINDADEYVEVIERTVVPSAIYGTSGNLRNVKTYYPGRGPEVSSGRLKSELHPDGKLDSYSYNRDVDGSFITTVTYGTIESPSGVANKTTRKITTLDPKGNEVVQDIYIYTGSGHLLSERIETDFDDLGQIIERRRNDRIIYSATYQDSLKTSETDDQGVTFLYTYDSRENIASRTKVGMAGQSDVVTTYTYNANDKLIEKTVSSDGLSLTELWSYDLAGRLVAYSDSADYTTFYEYLNDGRTIVRTNADTSVVITDRYLDGQPKSISGSGTVDGFYSYSVAEGSIAATVTVGNSNSLRTTTTVRDMLGRVVSQSTPAFGGGSAVTQMEYDDRGLLIRQSQTELADTLFQYDLARQLFRSGLDINGNGVLDLTSSDRITDTDRYFWLDAENKWWQIEQTKVYPQTGSSASVTVRENRVRINGHAANEANEVVAFDTHGNRTTRLTLIDRSTATMAIAIDTPDSTLDAVDVYVNGLLQSRTTKSVSEPTLFGYDGLGRKISEKSPRHTLAAEWEYDPLTGLLAAVRDAAGNETAYTYYSQGQVGAGKVAAFVDALGQVAYREYNLRGQLVRVWGETEYPVEYSYNPFGERVEMTTFRSGDDVGLWTASVWPATTPAGDLTAWYYDEATGLLTAKVDAVGESVSYTYTPAGRMAERFWARLDGNGQPLRTGYTYDPLTGERLLVDYSDDTPDIGYVFNRLGQLDSVTDAAGSRTFAYNADLQLESETIAAFYGANKRLTHAYESGSPGSDVVGRYVGFAVGTSSNPDQDYTVTYGFDGYGRLNGVADLNSNYAYAYVTGSGSTSISNLLATVSSPVHTTVYSYESNRDVKTEVQNGLFSKYTYRYDAIGRRTDRVQQGIAFSQASFDAFNYNTRSEVIGSDRYLGSDPEDVSTPVVADAFAYAFDPIGNRLTSAVAGVTESYATNDLNQYLTAGAKTFAHDEDGNLTNDGGRTFAWTAENRLRSIAPAVLVNGAQKIDFEYDYLGRRISKIVSEWNGIFYAVVRSEKFLYEGWNLTAVYDAENANALTKTYTWGLDLSRSLRGAGGVGGLLGVEELSGTYSGVYYYAYDANGNVAQVLNGAGGTAAHYEYDPFGNTIYSSGAYANRNSFRFSTKYRDEGGFYYYGYRYYDPAMGRWLSRDPIGENGGRNLYAFVRNGPIHHIDALGLKVMHRGSYEEHNILQFNKDMNTLRESGRGGEALANWAESPDTIVDVDWGANSNAAGGAGNEDSTPNPNAGGISLNNQDPNYLGPNNSSMDKSGDSVTTLSHELGHASGFESEPDNINTVENEIRKDRGQEPRTDHKNYPDGLPDATDEAKKQWEEFKDKWAPKNLCSK